MLSLSSARPLWAAGNCFTLNRAAASTGSAPRSNVRFRTLPCVAFGSSDSARSSSRSPSTFSDIRVIRGGGGLLRRGRLDRSEEHTSELQSLMRSSYAVFCLQKKKKKHIQHSRTNIE